MPAKDSWTPILRTVDLLIAEIGHLREAGPHFRIVHHFRMPGCDYCQPGEEIVGIFLVHRGYEYQLRLSLTQALIFDYLARHARLAQSARQIELGIRNDAFCQNHAKNASGPVALTRRVPRSSIKEHIGRLHLGLRWAFQEAGLRIDPRKVLIVQATAGNEVLYRLLRATVSWVHVDLTSPDCQPLP
jgi:hypothetical protein